LFLGISLGQNTKKKLTEGKNGWTERSEGSYFLPKLVSFFLSTKLFVSFLKITARGGIVEARNKKIYMVEI